MLYHLYDYSKKSLQPVNQSARLASQVLLSNPGLNYPLHQMMFGGVHAAAMTGLTLLERATRKFGRPIWDISERNGIEVHTEVVTNKAFCVLRKFTTRKATNKPVLLIAPMSGHYSTLLKDTVYELLEEHDVYITDWEDAGDVPMHMGSFTLDDYVDYICEFMDIMPKPYGLVAVCQPTVPTAVACALQSDNNPEALPNHLVLMGGPLNPDACETEVTKLATDKGYKWFERNCIFEVPYWRAGFGRKVYPGFLQLGGFIAMNPDRHLEKHLEMARAILFGDAETAENTQKFYDEYLAVMDLDADFYLETIDQVFIRRTLSKGVFEYKDKLVSLDSVSSKLKIMTIEGEKDDISAPGQTSSALDFFKNVSWKNKKSHIEPGAGHYGIFSGSKWKKSIRPLISDWIKAEDKRSDRLKKTAKKQSA